MLFKIKLIVEKRKMIIFEWTNENHVRWRAED
jgi:hypothetical protein